MVYVFRNKAMFNDRVCRQKNIIMKWDLKFFITSKVKRSVKSKTAVTTGDQSIYRLFNF